MGGRLFIVRPWAEFLASLGLNLLSHEVGKGVEMTVLTSWDSGERSRELMHIKFSVRSSPTVPTTEVPNTCNPKNPQQNKTKNATKLPTERQEQKLQTGNP